jgi:hypothetical protein
MGEPCDTGLQCAGLDLRRLLADSLYLCLVPLDATNNLIHCMRHVSAQPHRFDLCIGHPMTLSASSWQRWDATYSPATRQILPNEPTAKV